MPSEVRPSQMDPEAFYAYCQDQVQRILQNDPPLSSLDVLHVMWVEAEALCHALEIASRVYFAAGHRELPQVLQAADLIIRNPIPLSLYHLWFLWNQQRPDLPEAVTAQVPVYFLLCRNRFFACAREEVRQTRKLERPVFQALAAMKADVSRPAAARIDNFLSEMDAVLSRTVKRHLAIKKRAYHTDDPAATADKEGEALLGATAKEGKIRSDILKILMKGGTVPARNGQTWPIPTISDLPVVGMETAEGMDAVLRDCARQTALKIFAAFAPGVVGGFERALPDAAHAAQRALREREDAKIRGGSGGLKAAQAGTQEPNAVHVPLESPNADPDSDGLVPEPLKDPRLNPEKELQAMQEAQAAMQIAIEHWGESGKTMIAAILDEMTYKEAAEGAGIVPSAITKRLEILRKLLSQ